MDEAGIVQVPSDACTYPEYRRRVSLLLQENRTTGDRSTPESVEITRLNEQRMNRMEKQVVLLPEWPTIMQQLPAPETWLVLTEAWCGDSAQCIPVMHRIAEASASHITLLLTGRDAHPELMDRFMTNGTRSIPKLIRIRTSSGEVLGSWGPRPAPGQAMLYEWKAAAGAQSKDEFHRRLHVWYARDRGETLQHELAALLKETTIKKPI